MPPKRDERDELQPEACELEEWELGPRDGLGDEREEDDEREDEAREDDEWELELCLLGGMLIPPSRPPALQRRRGFIIQTSRGNIKGAVPAL